MTTASRVAKIIVSLLAIGIAGGCRDRKAETDPCQPNAQEPALAPAPEMEHGPPAPDSVNRVLKAIDRALVRGGTESVPHRALNAHLDSLLGVRAADALLVVALDTVMPYDGRGRSIRWEAAALLAARPSGPRVIDAAIARAVGHTTDAKRAETFDDRDLVQLAGLAAAFWHSPAAIETALPGAHAAVCILRGTYPRAEDTAVWRAGRRAGTIASLLEALERSPQWSASTTDSFLESWPDSSEAGYIRRQVAYLSRTRGMRQLLRDDTAPQSH